MSTTKTDGSSRSVLLFQGGVSPGRTIDEALANIREAIELSLETREAEGIATAIEVAEVEVETLTR